MDSNVREVMSSKQACCGEVVYLTSQKCLHQSSYNVHVARTPYFSNQYSGMLMLVYNGTKFAVGKVDL